MCYTHIMVKCTWVVGGRNKWLAGVTVAASLSLMGGCGGGGSGGGSGDPPPEPADPPIDIQLVNVTVFQGVEIFSTDYVRNAANQAVEDQTAEHAPLVEGRRTFVTLTFTQNWSDIVDVELRRAGETVALDEVQDPATNEEGRNEYVFELAGEHSLPSTSLMIEVDPDNEITQTHDGANDITFSLGAEETTASEVMKLVFVPIKLEDGGPTTEDIEEQLDELVRELKTHMPLTQVEGRVREVYEPEIDPEAQHPIRYTSKLWAEESGPGEYYHGVSFRIGENTTAARGGLEGYVSAQIVDRGSAFVSRRSLTHEVGHNLSLGHPPGCDAGSLDPDYPHDSNLLEDEKGWKMEIKYFVEEGKGFDLMGYCTASTHGSGTTHFISQYNFTKAARFYAQRIAEEEDDAQESEPPPGGIVIMGTYDGLFHEWSIEEVSYTPHDARVLHPNATGHALAVIDSVSGVALHSEPLLVATHSHDPDPWTRHWAVRIPVPEYDDFYLEIREADGRLSVQQDIRKQYKKLEIPQD